MMVVFKNAYLKNVRDVKEKAYRDGVWDGMRMGFNIVAIALNHKFGFGETRLKRLEGVVQDLVEEIVDTADPLVTKVHIEREIKRIRGEAWDT